MRESGGLNLGSGGRSRAGMSIGNVGRRVMWDKWRMTGESIWGPGDSPVEINKDNSLAKQNGISLNLGKLISSSRAKMGSGVAGPTS